MRKFALGIAAFAIHACVASHLVWGQRTQAPWSISDTQKILSLNAGMVSATLSPAGEVYLFGNDTQFSFPPATASFGNTSQQVVSSIEKLDSTGKPLYTIAFGGVYGIGVLFDSASNVYLTGAATATGLYTTPGAYRSSGVADRAAFVCKLRPSDGTPIYCTYLDVTSSAFLGVDNSGAVTMVFGFISGGQATAGSVNLGKNIYVAKLNSTGSGLIYGATFGGSDREFIDDVVVDPAGNVYITGTTYSSDFPTTPNAVVKSFQPQPQESQPTSFTVGLNSAGTAFLYSTLGSPGEQSLHIALDPSGSAQIMAQDSEGNLFVRRYSADGSAIEFETPLPVGISPGDAWMAIDSSGMTTIRGVTSNIFFPLYQAVQGCHITTFPAGWSNAFLIRLNSSGVIAQSTFLQDSGTPEFIQARVGTLSTLELVWNVTELPKNQLSTELDLVTLAPTSSGPTITFTCMANAATLTGAPLAPGEIVSLFGSGLGPTSPVTAQPGPEQSYPSSLSNTQVTFDGVPAPLIYVSSNQINAVTPFTLSPNSTPQVCVIHAGTSTNCLTAGVLAATPGIFLNPAVRGLAAALNQDGTVNSQDNPAQMGSVVSLFVTGLGAPTPRPSDGSLIPFPPPVQNLPVQVQMPNPRLGNPLPIYAEVLYAGPAPFEIAGMSQINIQIPPDLTKLGFSLPGLGFKVLVTLTDGTTAASNSALIYVSLK
jgi:uncharacterized protein (TIGR03437 family)